MKITFDTDLKVAGIGLVPWTRLGPERWLPKYAVASLYGWDVSSDTSGIPRICALSDQGPVPPLSRMNTQALLHTKEFQALLDAELPGYDILTYRPVSVPPELAGRKFLMADEQFTKRYENKVAFRQRFADTLAFPPFAIYERHKLGRTQEYFQTLLAGRPGFVIQDERLSGGKGTFVVMAYEEYLAALEALDGLSQHARVVISDLITGARERSIQACVTREGVFTGPLQRQIVRHPLLAKLDAAGDKFCGAAVVTADQQSVVHTTATAVAQQIGSALQAEGYKGVFGVDFLLDAEDRLLTLEVNPRLTGVTPLLTALYGPDEGVPFYLLHLLELGGYEYRITDRAADIDKEGALLVMHSLADTDLIVGHLPASGTYRLETTGELQRVSDNVRLTDLKADEFLLQEYVMPGIPVKPGGRLAMVLFNRQVIDTDTDKLYNDVLETITAIQQHITA